MRPPAEEIAAAARTWIGTPYRHRAATLGAGCDCLGLVRGVWRTLYGGEPEAVPAYGASVRDMRHAGGLLALAERHLVPLAAPEVGAVLLFRIGGAALPRHCGILVGVGRLVHAQERLGVVEVGLGEGWGRRVARVFGFPEKQ